MTGQFTPQPYPLFAVTVEKSEGEPRFELTSEPVRLVLGWVQQDDGTVLPMLAGSPLTAWDGPVLFEETRERAEATAKAVDKADRTVVRDVKILAFLDRFDQYLNR